jgi:hypothetical protein
MVEALLGTFTSFTTSSAPGHRVASAIGMNVFKKVPLVF